MTQANLPVVRPLPRGFSLADVFGKFAALPGCLWLDSASAGPRNSGDAPLGRYSFLTADPLDSLVSSVGDDDPWPRLDDWCRALPREVDPKLPPFQGGIAGLWGYEAATWLEQVGVAVTPGRDFGFHRPESHLRFAYTTTLPKLQEGVQRLRGFIG